MKLLKNMMVLVVLCALNSLRLEAKQMGVAKTAAPAPIVSAPTKGMATYKQLHDKIMMMNKNQVIDTKTGMLSQMFIDNTAKEAKAAGIDSLFVTLLQTGVAKFAVFPNDEQKAIDLVKNINKQIEQAYQAF